MLKGEKHHKKGTKNSHGEKNNVSDVIYNMIFVFQFTTANFTYDFIDDFLHFIVREPSVSQIFAGIVRLDVRYFSGIRRRDGKQVVRPAIFTFIEVLVFFDEDPHAAFKLF